MTRLGQRFLEQEGLRLGNYVEVEEGAPELAGGMLTLYHYTHAGRLDSIFSPGGGLHAQRPVACPQVPVLYQDRYLVEGFLQPLPNWLTNCPYYGNLGYKLMRQYIGDVLLEVVLPVDEFLIAVADYAHILFCKQKETGESAGLPLEYDCRNGRESTQAYVNSYIPVKEFVGGHICPVVQVMRKGEGLAIPNRCIRIAKRQPLQ